MRGPPSRKAPLHEIALIGLQVVVAAASTLLVARLVHERRTRPATGWLVVYAAAIWLWAVFAVVEATAPQHYSQYNPDYYATFFTDPDGIRLELVCRTPYRDKLVTHWDEFTVFLNPLAEYLARQKP